MNMVIAGALASVIVVGGCVLIITAAAGMVWLFAKIEKLVGESTIDTILNVILAVLMCGVFLATWFAAFSWLKGWL